MRASRLLSILMLLQTRGRLSAETLAEEFEVSVRTIYRDIDQLSATGAPVYAERGRNGGFALLDGYRTRLTGLTDSEAETLFLGGLAGPAAQLGVHEAMATAQLKLLAALPPERQAAAERVAARFHLDPLGWFHAGDSADRLPAIASAVWNSRRIEVRYESWKGEVARTLDPLGLVLKSGVWYLVARAGGQPRTYRVSNIVSLTTTDETFERPQRFDLAAFWGEASARFEREVFTGSARLRLTAEGLRRLPVLGSAYEALARGVAAPPARGTVELEVPIESVEHAARDFLRLGPEAEVLAPAELRSALAAGALALAALYADDPRA
jgi:predicted DNA-binding transcriptional regulator YafY